MTGISVDRMSREGATEVIGQICEGLKRFVDQNPECAQDLLKAMIEGFLEPWGNDDRFGTEGWEVGLDVTE